VSDVGSKTHQAEVNFNATDGLRERHQNSLLSISGVNLDEEAANLIKYQQAYQAAAQVISVAGTLFDTLIGAVRR
jgi:flagellar hook-associated protein 1 FlgK